MENLFISQERKLSTVKGTGVQYIPGHIEPLVDLVIDKYLPENGGKILDLGGGGLRFAIPVASLNKKITVVDLDQSGLDINSVYFRMRENGIAEIPDYNLLKKNISIVVDDVFNFLEISKVNYSLITAFRLIHFFNTKEVILFLKLAVKRINKNGKLVISAMSEFNDDNITYNEVFNNSISVRGNEFYRRFIVNDISGRLQKEQNLGSYVHLFSETYLKEIAQKNNLKMIIGNLPSTRIVRGYVFTR